MRLPKYIKLELLNATNSAFSNAKLLLFGSRINDSKRGGDFDIAVVCDLDRTAFQKAKVQFFKYLILKDLDLPIDLVHYQSANELLKREIDKGEVII